MLSLFLKLSFIFESLEFPFFLISLQVHMHTKNTELNRLWNDWLKNYYNCEVISLVSHSFLSTKFYNTVYL